jgi:ribosomal protein L11 methyltransferase
MAIEWSEVILETIELGDEIAAILAETEPVAAAGVEVRGAEVVLWAPAPEAEAARLALVAAAQRLADAGLPVDPTRVSVRPAKPEAEWRDAWKRFFKVSHIGRRLVIVPSWEHHDALAGEVVLDLDPGRAFGTGLHASTRLCLLELEGFVAEGRRVARVLDVGTGSGILTMAALRLYPAATAVAVDNDEHAVAAAAENLDRPDLVGRVRLGVEPVGEIPGEFDVVLANIQAEVLLALRDGLVARVAPGGVIVLSGLLTPQAEGVGARFVEAGLTLARIVRSTDDPEWSSVTLIR